ncbi:hypothetical protein LTR91_017736 [Friedmanniomyces endolithicus]|uniref:Uncharacterized protein n=1 Tax=Friedmanniomyces endolithicus TaxID=329885 RepID=A0AAN6K5L1_9PEZI|nr:hypothetical protein LTR94_012285 [Friedmanniomyces endolithicus]KAK0809488.1 hypothetical protein LTR75_005929 [Friedmanniomyces endolithicus]KAK0812305.1 hypothetical protein LTR38_003326 [Friedmanniomyces endolithicus]KAK0813320.1 hypothetical protein LTR59_001104 [Friedmanniomyces endolithicus]KAK0849510.1 hypothetical protein LTR03_005146 [Friedmanniomyces endolithicus]
MRINRANHSREKQIRMQPISNDPPPEPQHGKNTPDLQQVEAALQSLQIGSGNAALSTLAAGSKAYPDIRARLATPDVLRTLVEAAECGLNDSLETTAAALRCIGNACIDNDVARETIAGLGFSWAVLCLRHDNEEISWLMIKSKDTGTLIDLLFWITGYKVTIQNADSDLLSDESVLELLMLPYYYHNIATVEDFAILLEICLSFLRDPSVQRQVVKSRYVACVWQMFVDCKDRMDHCQAGEYAQETKELLKPLSTSLIWCLSDIAASEDFTQQYPPSSAFIERLLSLIASGGEETGTKSKDAIEQAGLGARQRTESHTIPEGNTSNETERRSARSIAAACQIVGNMLRVLPPQDITPLVMTRKIHAKLWHILAARTYADDDDDVAHSFAGFLVQLTRPSVEVREFQAEGVEAEEALRVLCEHKTPQIRQDGIRLLRALGKECPVNQERFRGLAARVAGGSGGGTGLQIEAAPA